MTWSADAFESRNLRAFRAAYPGGRNWLVTSQTSPPYSRSVAGLELTFVGIESLRTAIAASVL